MKNFVSKDYKTAEQRKRKSIEFLSELRIDYSDDLPVIEDSSEVRLKDVDFICKKAISTLLIIQVAHDALNKEFEKSKSMLDIEFELFGVEDYLNKKEKELWNGKFTKQKLIDITWEYETYWALIWALGIISEDEIIIPNDTMDYIKAIKIVSKCKSYDEFKSKIKIRSIEEILDMLDLYYRYNWATVENKIRFKNPLKIKHEVVVERRKGLEWLVSDISDWDEISLDT